MWKSGSVGCRCVVGYWSTCNIVDVVRWNVILRGYNVIMTKILKSKEVGWREIISNARQSADVSNVMLWSRSCIVLSDTIVTDTISCTSFYAALNSSDKAIQLQF